MLYVRDNGSIAVGLILTVWMDRLTPGGKWKRKLCSGSCPCSDCFGFRVVELKQVSQDNMGALMGIEGNPGKQIQPNNTV